MRKLLSKIWFPSVLTLLVAVQSFGIDAERLVMTAETDKDTTLVNTGDSSVVSSSDSLSGKDSIMNNDTSLFIPVRDTLKIPDSLRLTDTLKYKYYIALKDTVTRAEVRDSLRAAGDSLELYKLDSLVYKDSSETARADSIARFNALSKKDKKKYLAEIKMNRQMVMMDSILRRKDSLKAIKDSIIENTPRILETYAFTDSMKYKRIVKWEHDRYFNNLEFKEIDTTFNYYFNDYPFFRKDINATYLGVIGSATETYDYFKREEAENAFFHTPYLIYTYTPENLPMYNTKTPYTELAYWGTLFANSEKEETDIRLMTTQNILPEWNVSIEYNRFGSNGMLRNEKTDNRTFVLSTNYTGKRYLMHAGYIFNRIKKGENGGAVDNFWLRDTTVDSREINVHLNKADNFIKKNTIFLDQSYRIPFNFLSKEARAAKKAAKEEKAYRDSILASGDSVAIEEFLAMQEELTLESDKRKDSLNTNVTTAFIGHSSEYSVFTKKYTDEISESDEVGRNFYNNNFFLHPTISADSLRVMKFDNRIYIRLQPWAADGIISKIDVGIGDKLLNYYNFGRESYLNKVKNNTVLNSVYLYAGAQGQLKKYIHWDATGRYTFLGRELNDFDVDANVSINFFPFRRDKKSPLNLSIHFETGLKEPDYYQQHIHSNHFWWDNDFGKISTTKAEAALNIPRWKFKVGFGYALLKNNLYYDSKSIIRQNQTPMSVMTATVIKNFKAWKFHFDHQLKFQLSSNEDVLPLPMLAFNFRYYFQFDVVKNVMQMQLGANATYTTKWHASGYNPALGVFYNQKEELYGNCPYIDVFVNIQWKRACIFVKAVNVGMGWPNNRADYFSAHHYIRPQRAIKFGIFWPFYVQPKRNASIGGNSQAQPREGQDSGTLRR